MHIAILTYGSRGDIQPFLALALGLQKGGHSVCLAGPGRFAEFSAQHGVPFAPLAGDPGEISLRLNDAGANPFRMVGAMQDYIFAIAPEVVRAIQNALDGADLVVHSFLFTTGGHAFARQRGIPDVSVQTFPMFAPTRAFPNVAFPNVPPGGPSWLTHWLATQIFWHGGNRGYYALRRKFPGDFPEKVTWPFKPVPDRPLPPLLFAYSPTVLPRPVDWTAPNISIPGYFFLDEPGYRPPVELADFIVNGDPPMCISFGSMVNRKAAKVGRLVLDSLQKLGRRGIVLTGWGGWKPDQIPANVLYLDSAPHAWLFPRCRLVVHHGGAGTTAAGLRAGVPSVIIPFAADQPFWAKRVAALGVGPEPLPLQKLTSTAFTAALEEALHDGPIRQRAAEIGAQVRSEDGVGAAVRIIEKCRADFSS